MKIGLCLTLRNHIGGNHSVLRKLIGVVEAATEITQRKLSCLEKLFCASNLRIDVLINFLGRAVTVLSAYQFGVMT